MYLYPDFTDVLKGKKVPEHMKEQLGFTEFKDGNDFRKFMMYLHKSSSVDKGYAPVAVCNEELFRIPEDVAKSPSGIKARVSCVLTPKQTKLLVESFKGAIKEIYKANGIDLNLNVNPKTKEEINNDLKNAKRKLPGKNQDPYTLVVKLFNAELARTPEFKALRA